MANSLYLDASAIVKLAVDEPESSTLGRRLAAAPLVSSEIAPVEVARAAYFQTRSPAAIETAEALLRRFELVSLSEIRAEAARLGPPELRALDAIHLASALRVRDRIDAFVVYDRRLREAAQLLGLPVESPGA